MTTKTHKTPNKRRRYDPRPDLTPTRPTAYREMRLALGMTQIELADYLGVSPRAVRGYESGARKVKGAVARLYAALKGGG